MTIADSRLTKQIARISKANFKEKMTKALTVEETRERLPRQVKNAKNTFEIDVTDDELEIENVEEVNTIKQTMKGPRVTITGKTLDQQKMLRRKMENCDNAGWITVNREAGQYPHQTHVTLKTGLFELFQGSFLVLMSGFNIFPLNKSQPEESLKITLNTNGAERAEYDLSMAVGDLAVNLKIKMYSTTSSFDVQGLKPHFSTVFDALGNRTIAVYFVEVILESIFQTMRKECNLDDYNNHLKSQAKLGMEASSEIMDKKSETKGKKAKAKNVAGDKKCSICDSNSKELNSFKCLECAELFHKQCVNKRTSSKEFSLLKKGDIGFNCETCIRKRMGISTLKTHKSNVMKSITHTNEELEKDENKSPTNENRDDPKDSEVIIDGTSDVDNNVEKNEQNEEESVTVETVSREDAPAKTKTDEPKSVKDVSTSTSGIENDCVKCVDLESKVATLVSEIEAAHEAATHVHEKLEQIVNENESLKIKLNAKEVNDDVEDQQRQRADLDMDRIKFLYEKSEKENVKLTEKHKKEMKDIVSQKLESDNRYNLIVKEREKFRETERILLNTFDLWKSKFESAGKTEESPKESPEATVRTPQTPEESLYHCDECEYEATTLADLKEHKKDNHNEPDFKCENCGHTVLSESDLKGHMEAYHGSEDNNFQTVFLCNECDDEFEVKSELENHIQSKHTRMDEFTCDKCDYKGVSSVELEHHRKSIHSYFIYFCGACKFETTNTEVLKRHRLMNHGNLLVETKKEKLAPPPRCNPKNVLHRSTCCDRDPRMEKPVIYSHEQRSSNGICINWNKGYCEKFDLCEFQHVEIEACRFANYCSRMNCRFWHDIPGKFPFLEGTGLPRTRAN